MAWYPTHTTHHQSKAGGAAGRGGGVVGGGGGGVNVSTGRSNAERLRGERQCFVLSLKTQGRERQREINGEGWTVGGGLRGSNMH